MVLKSFLTTFILFVCVATLRAEKIEWMNDYAEAKKIARQTGKPLLLDFTAEWCGLCRAMDKYFWTRADIIEIAKQFVSVKIDGEKEAHLAKRFGVDGFPTVVVTDAWGLGIDSHTGFGQNADRVIIGKAASFPKDFTTLKKIGVAPENDRNDPDALREFAAFYSQRKLYNLSTELYSRFLKSTNEPAKREEALYNLASDSLQIGRPTQALAFFETLQKEYPQSARTEMVEYGIFFAHLRKNNLVEAEKHLEMLEANFPQSKMIFSAKQMLEKERKRK